MAIRELEPGTSLITLTDDLVTALINVADKLDRVQAAASLSSFVTIYFGYLSRLEAPPSGMKEYIEANTGLTLPTYP